ncbi:MAG TPA: hypothetical protein VKU79_05530 [Thermoplasmataceae archaeon]|nr:hypothetical protein [Thermoplasmatales archaeon AK]HLH86305.1 hypothetical protein [Thermoplasmataceae archaeon]
MSPEIRTYNINGSFPVVELREFLMHIPEPFLVVMRRKCVLTKLQIREAYRRSHIISGRSGRYRKPESVFLILMSGRAQISEALAECGISESTESAVAVSDRKEYFDLLESRFRGNLTRSNEGIPEDDPALDSVIFPRMTYISLDL